MSSVGFLPADDVPDLCDRPTTRPNAAASFQCVVSIDRRVFAVQTASAALPIFPRLAVPFILFRSYFIVYFAAKALRAFEKRRSIIKRRKFLIVLLKRADVATRRASLGEKNAKIFRKSPLSPKKTPKRSPAPTFSTLSIFCRFCRFARFRATRALGFNRRSVPLDFAAAFANDSQEFRFLFD